MNHSTDGIQRLVLFPFRKSLEIAFQSIRVRFFRSLITTLSLVLAVSFVCYINVNTDVANGMLSSGDPLLRQVVAGAGYDVQPGMDRVDASPKQRWIVILSLLVCAVGIVNAQLMAVTERFREIGTMKCLGALDSFILRLFVLEAGMQGFSGAAAGALLGIVISLFTALVRFGWAAVAHVSLLDLSRSFGISVLIGCALSLAGVLYPALVAARMQPVEAMRTEH